MFAQPVNDLLIRHPGLIVVETDEGILLRGPIKIKDVNYHVSVSVPEFPKLNNFKLIVRQGFVLKKIPEVKVKISKSWSIVDLIDNLPCLLSQTFDLDKNLNTVATSYNCNSNNNKGESVECFYAEIAALHKPNAYDVQLNAACTLIRFCKFSINEQHYLEVKLPSLEIRGHSLPDCVRAEELLSKCETLTLLVEQFQKYVEELQPFYECFHGIDELCYVVQPAKATTKDNYRLFVLKERVFIRLVIENPFEPLSSMSIHIIGPTASVEEFRRMYSEGFKNWDNEMDIQKNLLRIFNLCYFPMPPDGESEGSGQQFCNICYSYRVEGNERNCCNVPIVSCDNPQCTLIFHVACLMEWFNSLSDNVSFLDVSFGSCPFCKAKLSTSFAELLNK